IEQDFIAGEWVKAQAVGPIISPADLKEVIGEYARATRADAEAAIAAAKAASYGFARSNPQARYDALMMISNEITARKDEFGKLLSREEGKTLVEGVGEAGRAAQI